MTQDQLSATWNTGIGEFNGVLEFGNLTDGAVKILSVNVKNVGESLINGPAQLISSDFDLVYSSCNQVSPGKSCVIKVSFNPNNKNNQIYTAALQLGSYQADLSASVNIPQISEELSASIGRSSSRCWICS